MSEFKSMLRLTAKVIIDLDPEIITTATNDDDPDDIKVEEVKLRRLFVRLERRSTHWVLIDVKGSGARRYNRSNDGWRAAYYEVKNLKITPEMDLLIQDAIEQVQKDCKRN